MKTRTGGRAVDRSIGHTPASNSHSVYRQQLLPPSAISAIDFENYPTPQSLAIPKDIIMIVKIW